VRCSGCANEEELYACVCVCVFCWSTLFARAGTIEGDGEQRWEKEQHEQPERQRHLGRREKNGTTVKSAQGRRCGRVCGEAAGVQEQGLDATVAVAEGLWMW
jgi:hypothetical protein